MIRFVLLAVAAASLLSACTPKMPSRELPVMQDVLQGKREMWDQTPPIRRIKIPGNFFLSQSIRHAVPSKIKDMPLSLQWPSGALTLGDLVVILEEGLGISISYSWDSESNLDSFLARKILFRGFDGTLGGLLDKLEKSMSVAYWWDSNSLFLSGQQRYTITVPQNEEILGVIEDEIANLGGDDVIGSLYGGQVIYTASPKLNSEVIVPFLRRLSHNLSEVTMQVAIVSVALTSADNRGFDWDAFRFNLQEAALTTLPIGTLTGSALSGTYLESGVRLFGRTFNISIASAINFLSTFGRTSTEQNVELRTIAGQSVHLDNGQEIPYVESITNSGSGVDATTSVQFGTLTTGLVLALKPNFDSTTGIVTVSVDLSVTDLLSMISIDSGSAGTVQRPQTQRQALTDLIRVPAGETVIIGGITTARLSDNRKAPFAAWKVGSSIKTGDRTALFIIIRPMVTVYELQDNEFPSAFGVHETSTHSFVPQETEDQKSVEEVPVVSPPPRPSPTLMPLPLAIPEAKKPAVSMIKEQELPIFAPPVSEPLFTEEEEELFELEEPETHFEPAGPPMVSAAPETEFLQKMTPEPVLKLRPEEADSFFDQMFDSIIKPKVKSSQGSGE